MLFRVFGTIPETYPNPPSSKPWAFWSKSANFEPFVIHPKSSQTFSKVLGNAFAFASEIFTNILESSCKSICEHIGYFSGVWKDCRNLHKSAMFKTMGYSPGFLVKIGRFRTLRNSSEIFTNILESSSESICEHIGCFSGSLDRFPKPTQVRHVQNHGL